MPNQQNLRNWDLINIDGNRLYLRLLMSTDTDLILRWRARPDVANQLFSERPPTRNEHDLWFSKLQNRDDRIEMIIVAHEGNFPIGTIGLNHIDRKIGDAEYGIMLGEQEWRGKGMAREASALIIDYSFETLGLQKLWLRVFFDNMPARSLYYRLGFIEDPLKSEIFQKSGINRKTMTMFLTPSAWENSRIKD